MSGEHLVMNSTFVAYDIRKDFNRKKFNSELMNNGVSSSIIEHVFVKRIDLDTMFNMMKFRMEEEYHDR